MSCSIDSGNWVIQLPLILMCCFEIRLWKIISSMITSIELFFVQDQIFQELNYQTEEEWDHIEALRAAHQWILELIYTWLSWKETANKD